MKKVNFFAKKPLPQVFVSTCSNAVHAEFHRLAYTRKSRPCDVVCLQSKHFRSIAGMIVLHEDLRAIEMKHETLPANRARLLDCTSTGSRSTGMRHACSRRSNGHCSRQSSSGHDRSECTTTKDRSRKRAVMAVPRSRGPGGRQVPGASAHVTPSKNKKNCSSLIPVSFDIRRSTGRSAANRNVKCRLCVVDLQCTQRLLFLLLLFLLRCNKA